MRNYDHNGGLNSAWRRNFAPPLELYRLYNTESGKVVRVDIEESKNLIDSLPEKARELNARLTEMLTEMNATYPSYNPHYSAKLEHKEKVPVVTAHNQNGQTVAFISVSISVRRAFSSRAFSGRESIRFLLSSMSTLTTFPLSVLYKR